MEPLEHTVKYVCVCVCVCVCDQLTMNVVWLSSMYMEDTWWAWTHSVALVICMPCIAYCIDPYKSPGCYFCSVPCMIGPASKPSRALSLNNCRKQCTTLDNEYLGQSVCHFTEESIDGRGHHFHNKFWVLWSFFGMIRWMATYQKIRWYSSSMHMCLLVLFAHGQPLLMANLISLSLSYWGGDGWLEMCFPSTNYSWTLFWCVCTFLSHAYIVP